MDKRSQLKKKIDLTENEELLSLEKLIAYKCEEKIGDSVWTILVRWMEMMEY